ncbi:MAG: hypothetical protein ACLURV_11440 [Gallintestinimicrobium sp.]
MIHAGRTAGGRMKGRTCRAGWVFAWLRTEAGTKTRLTLRRQIAVERVPQHHSVQKRQQIHTKPDRQRSTHRKQRQDIAGKIDRSDIVYKRRAARASRRNFLC